MIIGNLFLSCFSLHLALTRALFRVRGLVLRLTVIKIPLSHDGSDDKKCLLLVIALQRKYTLMFWVFSMVDGFKISDFNNLSSFVCSIVYLTVMISCKLTVLCVR